MSQVVCADCHAYPTVDARKVLVRAADIGVVDFD
jgi:hypothetical protein